MQVCNYFQIVKVRYGIKLPGVLDDFDKGNYTCIVKNKEAELIRTFLLDINSKCVTLILTVSLSIFMLFEW